mmetsp:Transcript_22179/g.61726  ORF Transcript_22179/g.61726 Transcript_22179/m.61726 type:complete len:213 (-) Transcript_22179:254-892(-)
MCASTLMPTVSSTSAPSRSPPERRTRSPSRTTRAVSRRTRSSAWSTTPRSTRPRMMPTACVSRPRTPSRTTATPSRDPSPPTRSRTRSQPTTRPSSSPRSKRPSPGWMPTQPPRRRSTKRSRRASSLSPCQSSSPWPVEPEVCQEACQAAQCQTWAAPEVPHQPLTQLADQPSRRSTKRQLPRSPPTLCAPVARSGFDVHRAGTGLSTATAR